MKKTIETSAKKLEDAIKQGLIRLGRENDDDVEINVISQGGFFTKAKVRLTIEIPDDDEEQTAKSEAPRAEAPKAAPVNKVEPAKEPATKPAKPEPAKPFKSEKSAKPAKPEKSVPENVNKKSEAKAPVAESAEKPEQKHEVRKTEIKLSPEQKTHIVEFLKGALQRMGMSAEITESEEDGYTVTLNAAEGDDSLIIGHRGETLDALQNLTELSVRVEDEKFVRFTLDCNGYRARRAKELAVFAKSRAKEAVRRHKKIRLEPMTRLNRRVIHQALGEDNRVVTVSEGKEPFRAIVIYPADMYNGKKRTK